MAALQSIRNHPVLLSTVLGGGLILMIIMFGLDDYNGLFQGDRDTVMSVNDQKVSWANFESVRQRKSDFHQTFYNEDVNKSDISRRINEETYNYFVQQYLLDEQLDKLGLGVSDNEINELAQGSHISPIMTQIFGPQAQQIGKTFADLVTTDGFETFAQQYNAPWATMQNWLEIESNIKSLRKAQKYAAIINTAVQPNKLEAEDMFKGDNEEVAFTYTRMRANEIEDSLVNVSKSDIKAYYESRKENFKMQQKSRKVSYIAVALRPSDDDRAATLASLEKAHEQFAGDEVEEVVNANSRISFIDAYLNNDMFRGELKELVDNNEAGTITEPAIFRGDILSLLGERSENDESLSEYYYTARILGKQSAPDSVKVILSGVTAETKDSILAEIKKGNMDEQAQWFTDLSTIGLDKDLRAKLFNTKAGEIINHTFNNGQADVTVVGKVLEVTAKVNQSKVAIYAEKINPSSKTRRAEYGKLNEFLNTYTTLAQMQDSARANGFYMVDATLYTTSYDVNQVRDARQAVRFAFEGKKGDISEIYEDGGYLLVVGIKGDVEEGYANPDDENLQSFIRSMVATEKKVAYIIEKNELAGKSVEEAAQVLNSDVQNASRVSFNTTNISGLGIEPLVAAKALAAEVGTVVGPIAGKNNVVVLKVTEKNNKNLTYDEAAYLNKASNGVYRNISNTALTVLNREADIQDNRIKFY